MSTITKLNPDIVVLEYRDDVTEDIVCRHARFYFDTTNYFLGIKSDCGDFGCSWYPSPDHKSFLHLSALVDADSLADKIAHTYVIDSCATFNNLKEYLFMVLGGEVSGLDFDKIESLCYCYANNDELFSVLFDYFSETKHSEALGSGNFWGCVVRKPTPDVFFVADAYEKHIVPELQKLAAGEDLYGEH